MTLPTECFSAVTDNLLVVKNRHVMLPLTSAVLGLCVRACAAGVCVNENNCNKRTKLQQKLTPLFTSVFVLILVLKFISDIHIS